MDTNVTDETIQAEVAQLHQAYQSMMRTFDHVIVGQRDVLEELLITVFVGGHNLLEGVPGLAKTLMIHTLADMLSLKFNRIQFTPDLMPSDIAGTNVIEEDHTTGKRVTVFVAGPVFTNIVLADEINRTPPKTQSALLQAMQEKQVSVGGKTYDLDTPFFVLATQNPIDQEGTYPLPEAQKDRFLLNTIIRYPQRQEEQDIIARTTGTAEAGVNAIISREQLLGYQRTVRSIPVSPHVIGYAVDLTRATRPREEGAPAFVREQVGWGAGPRAGQALILAAKCYAAMQGRVNVSCDDVRRLAPTVMRHRITPSFMAEAEGVTTDQIIEQLIDHVPEQTGALAK